MATILKPNNSNHNNNLSFKYKLNCQEKVDINEPDTIQWLELLSQINHYSNDYKIFEALLEKNKNVVVKIGNEKLKKEFEISNKLDKLNIPTFLAYHCIFSCLEKFSDINKNTKSLCKKNGDLIHILVMPFLKLGQIDKFMWTRNLFKTLLNILKHITLTLFYAFITFGFIHNDTHLGNIMLKKTSKTKINYGFFGEHKIEANLIPVIMDYDRSIIANEQQLKLVYQDLRRIFSLISNEVNIKMDTNNVITLLDRLSKNNTMIDVNVYNLISNEIDNISIRYITSELKLPIFTK